MQIGPIAMLAIVFTCDQAGTVRHVAVCRRQARHYPEHLAPREPLDPFAFGCGPSWQFSVPVCGFVLSSNSEAELNKIDHSWASAPSVLLHQDADGFYVERLLAHLRGLLPAQL